MSEAIDIAEGGDWVVILPHLLAKLSYRWSKSIGEHRSNAK